MDKLFITALSAPFRHKRAFLTYALVPILILYFYHRGGHNWSSSIWPSGWEHLKPYELDFLQFVVWGAFLANWYRYLVVHSGKYAVTDGKLKFKWFLVFMIAYGAISVFYVTIRWVFEGLHLLVLAHEFYGEFLLRSFLSTLITLVTTVIILRYSFIFPMLIYGKHASLREAWRMGEGVLLRLVRYTFWIWIIFYLILPFLSPIICWVLEDGFGYMNMFGVVFTATSLVVRSFTLAVSAAVVTYLYQELAAAEMIVEKEKYG